jgi:hypothetical protein
MKNFWNTLRNHLKADFSWRVYGAMALFLIIIITFNYSISLEKGIIDSYRGNPIRIVWYFLMYAFAYYGGVLIWVGIQKEGWRLLRLQRLE